MLKALQLEEKVRQWVGWLMITAQTNVAFVEKGQRLKHKKQKSRQLNIERPVWQQKQLENSGEGLVRR